MQITSSTGALNTDEINKKFNFFVTLDMAQKLMTLFHQVRESWTEMDLSYKGTSAEDPLQTRVSLSIAFKEESYSRLRGSLYDICQKMVGHGIAFENQYN
jgi:hypothetical protein